MHSHQYLIIALLIGLIFPMASARASASQGAAMRMVLIRLASPRALAELKKQPIDIVRVRRLSAGASDGHADTTGYMVEGVATPGVIEKLRRQGYRLTVIGVGHDGRANERAGAATRSGPENGCSP